MSALAISQPLIGLKHKTDSALDNAERIRRRAVRLAAVLGVSTIPNLLSLGRSMDQLIDILNSPEMDGCNEGDLKHIAHQLSQNGGRLNKLIKSYEDLGIRHMLGFRSMLDRLERANNHLASIVEGIYMSLNDDFLQMMGKTADELRSASKRPERRSLSGQVQA